MKYSAKLIGLTMPVGLDNVTTSEELIAYCARRSSGKPRSEWHEDYEGLLDYCIKNKHWSVFAMCDAIVEIDAPRDMLRQILRHKSGDFQEFSQRYSDQFSFTTREIRKQDGKNRQNSFDTFSDDEKAEFERDCETASELMNDMYKKWQDRGGAKECCRVFLPEGLTMGNIAFKAPVRTWLHYLDVREEEGVTQHEHVLIAKACRKAVAPYFPNIIKKPNTLPSEERK